jgi:hypothetical protein
LVLGSNRCVFFLARLFQIPGTLLEGVQGLGSAALEKGEDVFKETIQTVMASMPYKKKIK